jgi:hypothetical protein
MFKNAEVEKINSATVFRIHPLLLSPNHGLEVSNGFNMLFIHCVESGNANFVQSEKWNHDSGEE